MPHDYFQRAEFRAFFKDITNVAKYEDDQIDDAQEEVIEALENWAHSAWPNVVPVTGTGSMTLNDTTLTGVDTGFVAEDVGSNIRVVGAGEDGADLRTTVAAWTSATEVELAAPSETAVAGATIYLDGDGTAAWPRRRTDTRDGHPSGYVFLGYSPVISPLVEFADSEGDPFDADSYDLYPESGFVRFPRGRLGPRVYVATYDYGATSCPRWVKRPAMVATRTLIGSNDYAKSRIPDRTTQVTTEATTFLLDVPTSQVEPWPWDRVASDAVKRYWNRHRSVRVAGV